MSEQELQEKSDILDWIHLNYGEMLRRRAAPYRKVIQLDIRRADVAPQPHAISGHPRVIRPSIWLIPSWRIKNLETSDSEKRFTEPKA